MSGSDRQSSFMPAIKCSNCAEEIPLAHMGTHICPGGSEKPTATREIPQCEAPPTPAPEAAFLKPQRPLLPRIDINAGNRPGMFLGELTPASSRSSGLASPRSACSQKSPWRIPPRKASAPIRRPPSPELANLDCAFPPFPTSAAPRSKTPSQDKKTSRSQNPSAASTPRTSSYGPSSSMTKRTMSTSSSRLRNPSGMRPTGRSQPASANTSRRPSFNSAPATYKVSVEDTPPLPIPPGASPGVENLQEAPLVRTESSPMLGQNPQHSQSHTLTSSQSAPSSATAASLQAFGVGQNPSPLSDSTLRDSVIAIPAPAADQVVKKQSSYKAKRPPPIDSGRSLPLLQRFKSILTPRSRAPTFPGAKSDSTSTSANMMSGHESEPGAAFEFNDSQPEKDENEEVLVASPDEIPTADDRAISKPSIEMPSHPTTIPEEFDFSIPDPIPPTSPQKSVDPKATNEFEFSFPNNTSQPREEDQSSSEKPPSVSAPADDVPNGKHEPPTEQTPETSEPNPNNPRIVETLLGSIDISEPLNAEQRSPEPSRARDSSSYYGSVIGDVLDSTDGVEPTIEDTQATLHTSMDSTSSYYGSVTMSLHTTSSRSSLPFRDEATRTRSNTTQSAEVTKDLSLLDVHPTDLMASIAETEVFPEEQVGTAETSEDRKPTILDFPPLQPPRITEMQPDSPTEPLYQRGRLSPIPDQIDRHQSSQSRKASHLAHRSVSSNSKTVSPNKGTCRGCQNLIMSTQKSVSSADGRLTGRYHKECFACMTCKNAFTTADFYVLNDQPYCGPHYHELNGTVCGSCGEGIEGQYMETSTVAGKPNKKFHTHCLACATCRTPLREDYFELNGRVYCEKDAFRIGSLPSRSQYASAPTRPSPLMRELISSSISGTGDGADGVLGTKFPERRLTKLMDPSTTVMV